MRSRQPHSAEMVCGTIAMDGIPMFVFLCVLCALCGRKNRLWQKRCVRCIPFCVLPKKATTEDTENTEANGMPSRGPRSAEMVCGTIAMDGIPMFVFLRVLCALCGRKNRLWQKRCVQCARYNRKLWMKGT